MTRRIFIAGTDTEVGKTWAATQLMRELARAGFSIRGLKPVAAGGIQESSEGQGNDDALQLQALCTFPVPYDHVNPFLLQQPVAPHIAAEREGKALTIDSCVGACQQALKDAADILVVEGAGGWMVPLNERETMADLAVALDCSVILVVGMKLGCINHALLTQEAIRASGVKLAGWVANSVAGDMLEFEENISALKSRIAAPLLARIPFGGDFEQNYFNLGELLNTGS